VLNPSIESFPPRFVNRAVSGLAGARCAARFIVPRALARIAVCFDCWMRFLFVCLFVCLRPPWQLTNVAFRQRLTAQVITGGMVGEFGALCGRTRHASVKCTETHPLHVLACLDSETVHELEPPLLAALQEAALQFLSQRLNLYSLRTHFLD